MNEQIRLLAEQATTYIEPTADSGEGWIFDKEKFARLIVQECVAICRDIDGEEDSMARCGRQDCAVEIQEHFGVSE
jgi:hypothetical protein